MGFGERAILGVISVLLWSSAAAAQTKNSGNIVIRMQDDTGMATSLLMRAERDAAGVLHGTGIEVTWVNCPKGGGPRACQQVLQSNEFMLHIVPTGKTQNDLVFGEAFLGEGGTGKYADIFFQRIAVAEEEAGVDFSRLLGAVCVHELGHLLLGSHSHSTTGIMQPIWQRDSLHKIGMGLLLFTGQQSRTMKARLGRESFVLSSMRVPNRSTVDGLF